MNLLAPLARAFGYVPAPPPAPPRNRPRAVRSYNAAVVNRLTSDLTTQCVSPDTDLIGQLHHAGALAATVQE